jgi:hypothetical protein
MTSPAGEILRELLFFPVHDPLPKYQFPNPPALYVCPTMAMSQRSRTDSDFNPQQGADLDGIVSAMRLGPIALVRDVLRDFGEEIQRSESLEVAPRAAAQITTGRTGDVSCSAR